MSKFHSIYKNKKIYFYIFPFYAVSFLAEGWSDPQMMDKNMVVRTQERHSISVSAASQLTRPLGSAIYWEEELLFAPYIMLK